MAYYQPSIDDAFDDEGEDVIVVQKDWNRIENDVRKTGYRLGLSSGQEETLQTGFDAGYSQAALTAFAVGRLQGQISGSLAGLESALCGEGSVQTDGGTLVSSLTQLLEDCTQLLTSLHHRLQAHGHPSTFSSPAVPMASQNCKSSFPAAPMASQKWDSFSPAVSMIPQSQHWASSSPTMDTQNCSHVDAGTGVSDNNSHTLSASKQQSGANCEDGLREVTDLMDNVGLHELPPIGDPAVRQCFVSLLQRYRSLLGN